VLPLHQSPTNINTPASSLAIGHSETNPNEEHVTVQNTTSSRPSPNIHMPTPTNSKSEQQKKTCEPVLFRNPQVRSSHEEVPARKPAEEQDQGTPFLTPPTTPYQPVDNTYCQSIDQQQYETTKGIIPINQSSIMATTLTTTTLPLSQKCHFNTLSGELRNRIYSYFFATLLTQSHQTTIDIRTTSAQLARNAPKTRSALALTATSRQLRSETLALFWSNLSLRIVAGTLAAYSLPTDSIPGVHPMNRAHHINQDRADNLREWLEHSGVARFAKFLKPVELDLGMWDPRVHASAHQFIALRLLGADTQDLTRLLQGLVRSGNFNSSNSNSNSGKDHDDDDDDDNDDDNDNNNHSLTNTRKSAAGCTLRFKVQVVPSTALGSICVANERKQALASIAALCEGRSTRVEGQFLKGTLTQHGRFILLQDMAMCRSLAELLVGYIVEEEQEEDDDELVDGGGSKSQGRKKRAC
jgi:hypothetical protein